MREALTLNVVQGVGDVFWVYQKFAPHVRRLDLNVMVTVKPGEEPNYTVQTRALPFISLFPKVGSVTVETVPSERYAKTAKGIFRMADILYRDGPSDYACNRSLELGVRLEEIDPNLEVEECVALPEEDAPVPAEPYLLVFVSQSASMKIAPEYGVWSVESWARMLRILREEGVFPWPVVLTGAHYDRPTLEALADTVERDGAERPALLIDLPPKQVINMIRRAGFFIGHQSGLNVLAENVGTRQLMLYMKPLWRMVHAWCGKRSVATGVYRADLFSRTPLDVAMGLKEAFGG